MAEKRNFNLEIPFSIPWFCVKSFNRVKNRILF